MPLENTEREIDHVARDAIAKIDKNDVDSLRKMIKEWPELLYWRNSTNRDEVLLQATTSYANFPGREEENVWNRPDCAEVLLDAGALVDPQVILRIINTGAHGMLALFHKKGALPENLRIFAALGDLKRVQGCFQNGHITEDARPTELHDSYPEVARHWPPVDDDVAIIEDAFLYACRLGHESIGRFLLQECLKVDPDLANRLQSWWMDIDFVTYLMNQIPEGARYDTLVAQVEGIPRVVWRTAMNLAMHEATLAGNLDAIRRLLRDQQFWVTQSVVPELVRLLEVAAYSESTLPIIKEILDHADVLTKMGNPPASKAISYALEYGHAEYVPQLLRVWGLPDDLPHAAGMGDKEKVKKWFGEGGDPKLGDLGQHNPFPEHSSNLMVQDVLDRSLAWAVQNGEYDVADFLLERGADINTNWSTHEPASILHECAVAGRLSQVKFLVERGIDLKIVDQRFNGTAEDWARHGGQRDVEEYLKTIKIRVREE